MNRRRIRVALGLLALACCLLTPAAGAWAGVGGGTQRWDASYGAGTPSYSYDVAVSPDGSTVYTTGTSVYDTTDPGHFATVAVDALTGAKKWSAAYQSSSERDQRDTATRLAISPDGSKVFVTGNSLCNSCGAGGFNGFSTVAYDAATGTRLWVAKYAQQAPGGYSIAVSPDGSEVFVNGGAPGYTNPATTIAYDAATGSRLYVIPPDGASRVPWHALAVSPDSSTLYVATDNDDSLCQYQVAAYDAATGTPLWTATYPDCDNDAHMALALSPDGSTIYMAGSNHEFDVVAWNAATGAELWAATNPGMTVDGDIMPQLAVSPDGSKVVVVGNPPCVPRCADTQLLTAAYDAATGTRLWQSSYDSEATNYPIAVAVSADSSQVFVTAQEQMPCPQPWCTTTPINAPLIAYDADSGAEAWMADYQNNSSWALAVTPTGSNVYIAGTFTSLTSASSSSHLLPMAKPRCSPSACGYSVTAYNGHAGPGVSQDRDPSPSYDGWRTIFDRTGLGGAYRTSRTAGATATFSTPRTRKVVWIAHVGREDGRARVLIDGHPKGMVDLYAPAGGLRKFPFTKLPLKKHAVTIEVLGTKDAASSGRWVAFDAFNERGSIHEETALGVKYGTWRGVVARAASAGSYHVSKSPRARLTFAFTGHRINWITATGPAYGRARVVIDGVGHTVDLYRPRHHWRVKVSFTGLGPGTHHVRLVPLGAKDRASASANVVFDAFVVR
jgi:putative pyrroloquinoline-quinone binding quinoprotein